ncbi:MAG: TetR/AcrR family transcriptional regulator [Actinomycetota bacterium]
MSSRPGRRAGPTAETQEQVLQAAFRLLCDEGPAALTPVRIHQETGVARTTIYRHWPSAEHIVDDIMIRAIARVELDELTGDLAEDLATAVGTLTFRFENRPVAAFYRATLALDDPAISPTKSQTYIGGLIEPVRDVITSGVAAGQLRGDVDQLTASLCGPLLLDHLLLGRPVDAQAVSDGIDRFLANHGH